MKSRKELILRIIKKNTAIYPGAFFFGLLFILNQITQICIEVNNYLVFMTILCLFIPTIKNKSFLN